MSSEQNKSSSTHCSKPVRKHIPQGRKVKMTDGNWQYLAEIYKMSRSKCHFLTNNLHFNLTWNNFSQKKSLCSLVFEKEKELEIGPISFRKVGFFSFRLAFLMTLYTRRQIINIMIYTENRAVRIMAQTVLSFIMLP